MGQEASAALLNPCVARQKTADFDEERQRCAGRLRRAEAFLADPEKLQSECDYHFRRAGLDAHGEMRRVELRRLLWTFAHGLGSTELTWEGIEAAAVIGTVAPEVPVVTREEFFRCVLKTVHLVIAELRSKAFQADEAQRLQQRRLAAEAAPRAVPHPWGILAERHRAERRGSSSSRSSSRSSSSERGEGGPAATGERPPTQNIPGPWGRLAREHDPGAAPFGAPAATACGDAPPSLAARPPGEAYAGLAAMARQAEGRRADGAPAAAARGDAPPSGAAREACAGPVAMARQVEGGSVEAGGAQRARDGITALVLDQEGAFDVQKVAVAEGTLVLSSADDEEQNVVQQFLGGEDPQVLFELSEIASMDAGAAILRTPAAAVLPADVASGDVLERVLVLTFGGGECVCVLFDSVEDCQLFVRAIRTEAGVSQNSGVVAAEQRWLQQQHAPQWSP